MRPNLAFASPTASLSRSPVAVVTGASSSIGMEVIKRFLAVGTAVVATTRARERLCTRLAERGIPPHEVQVIETDLSDFTAEQKLREAIASVGVVDILVNAVGRFESQPTLELDPLTFLGSVTVNVIAPFIAIRAVLPFMIRQRGGAIINIGSLFGLTVPDNVACVAYGTSKAALVHLTKSLAMELGRYQIRVNCVCPGIINPMSVNPSASSFEKLQEVRSFLAQQALPRLTTAQEVAAAVFYLASEESAAVTGVILPVDGGARL